MIVLEPFRTARFLVGSAGKCSLRNERQFLEPIGSVVVAETTVLQPKKVNETCAMTQKGMGLIVLYLQRAHFLYIYASNSESKTAKGRRRTEVSVFLQSAGIVPISGRDTNIDPGSYRECH